MSEWTSEQLIRMAAEAEPMTPELWAKMKAEFSYNVSQWNEQISSGRKLRSGTWERVRSAA